MGILYQSSRQKKKTLTDVETQCVSTLSGLPDH